MINWSVPLTLTARRPPSLLPIGAASKSQTSNPASIEYLEGIARSYERLLGQGR